jgi:hypothetical protein
MQLAVFIRNYVIVPTGTQQDCSALVLPLPLAILATAAAIICLDQEREVCRCELAVQLLLQVFPLH